MTPSEKGLPWTDQATPVKQLVMDAPYLLCLTAVQGENPVRFFALTRPLAAHEYANLAMAGTYENKDILEVIPRKLTEDKLYLSLNHAGAGDPSKIIVAFDKTGNARFEIDPSA